MKIDDYIKKYNRQLSIAGGIVIILAVYGVFWMEAANADYYEPGEGGGGGGTSEYKTYSSPANGNADEGQTINDSFDSGGFVVEATFTLTWTDEPDSSPIHDNEGDTFTLRVVDPDAQYDESNQVTNEHGQSGEIVLTFNITTLAGEPEADVDGPWEVEVTCDDAGPQRDIIAGTTDPTSPDNGNSYTLSVEMSYRLG